MSNTTDTIFEYVEDACQVTAHHSRKGYAYYDGNFSGSLVPEEVGNAMKKAFNDAVGLDIPLTEEEANYAREQRDYRNSVRNLIAVIKNAS